MTTRVLLVKSPCPVAPELGIELPRGPPLGILALASWLRRRPDIEVQLVDLQLAPHPAGLRAVADAARQWQPHLIGVSATSAEWLTAGECATLFRAALPEALLVLGGAHATSMAEHAAASGPFDALVIGEGERTLEELVRLVEDHGPAAREPRHLAAIAGLAVPQPDGAQLLRTARREEIADLDSLPMLAWELLDLAPYWQVTRMAAERVGPYVPVLTSRGCPYGCAYCHHQLGRRFRPHSPQRVVEEIGALMRRHDVREVEVVDDIANLDAGRFDAILEGLLAGGLQPTLHFPTGLRGDLLAEHSIGLLRRVGVGEVSLAIETATARLQRLIAKDLDLERVATAIEQLATQRVCTRGFFMLGFPTETEEEMWATIEWACRSRLQVAIFFDVTPYPGTPLYDLFLRSGAIGAEPDPGWYSHFGATFNGSLVPDERLAYIRRQARVRFFSDPRRLLGMALRGRRAPPP